MRCLTLACVAFLFAACGSATPDSPGRTGRQVIVAAETEGSPAAVAVANWRRFVDNVRVWAPEYSLQLRLGADAATPAKRSADLQHGTVQLAGLGPDAATGLVPELAVLTAPELFDSVEEADQILDQVVMETYRRLFAEKGLRLLDWADDDWADPLTGRRYRTGVIVANNDWFGRLTPHDRDVFAQAYGSAGQARADSRAAARAGPSSAPREEPASSAAGGAPRAWSEAIRSAHAALIEQAGGRSREIYELILEGKQDFVRQSAGALPDKSSATR